MSPISQMQNCDAFVIGNVIQLKRARMLGGRGETGAGWSLDPLKKARLAGYAPSLGSSLASCKVPHAPTFNQVPMMSGSVVGLASPASQGQMVLI